MRLFSARTRSQREASAPFVLGESQVTCPGARKALWAYTALWCCLLVVSLGCRTAGSLGLPVSPGLNYMLPGVAKIRQRTGHPDQVPTELAKAALPTHRLEAGDSIIVEANDFSSPVRMPGDLTVARDGTVDLGQYGK